jgi:GNAT superfamily N-acetyltransferase
MITLRRITPNDLVRVMDTDNKCFEHCWGQDEWGYAAENFAVDIASRFLTPVGFSTYCLDPQDRTSVYLMKVGVAPNSRRFGAGTALIRSSVTFAKTMGARTIYGLIPESLCCPGQPRDASEWLKAMGFMAQRPVHKDYFLTLGALEDGIRFVLELEGSRW